MQINHIFWDKVIVKYETPIIIKASRGKASQKLTEATYNKASVRFDNNALTIVDGTYGVDKSILLTKAKLLKMFPWEMLWEAYWWEGEIGVSGFTKLVKAHVTCML